ncbi:rhamnan synthesis F family protein [Bifidobacterium pullorum subsp. saeculare]|uniref:Rhamnan synthesis F family protein n=1 Tax=Bifidobacterium pullorum subsp. saeculare TaxID=78257 RepID=A0A939B9R7_9BIFI|nr:rhamnan synthesis F family protein [Bifidobacterium pullorum]MBM6699813.1 rhamnan synthesis F family protein [Bifidobacterium pullorum subsp. saeculare]
MLLTGSPVNRLGIFFFYDAQGVVDDYVTTLLDGFRPHFSEMTIVCNGKLNDAGGEKLSRYTSNLIVRENKGFDVWAYKTALDSYGWDRLAAFDEVVLFNATIMGPVYPFSEMFETMNRRDLDFWGITKFHKVPRDPFNRSPYGYLPEHIQSHFHAYRRSLVTSKAFQDYWDNMPPIESYYDSVGLHESLFTKRFADQGFAWDVYVDTSDLEGFTYGPITFAAKQLVAEKRCPIFKRRSFFHDYADTLDQSVGNAALDLYEYLHDHTDYDTDLIWQNALRTMNMADLVKNLHLDFVLPSRVGTPIPEGRRVALVMHLYYMDLLDKTLAYASSMPEGCDFILTVGSEENAELVRKRCKGMPYNVDVRVIQNRGRDVSALLVGAGRDCLKYDYVCFAHDKKVTQLSPYSIGDGFAYKCFENILGSKELVSNIIDHFERDPHAGLLAPTAPNHADYFGNFGSKWGPNYTGTKEFLEELGIHVPLDPNKEPVAPMGTMFWFRPAAFKQFFEREWRYEDFPPEPNKIDGSMLHFIERAYGYVPQANGYYSGYVFSDRFARIEITNLSYDTQTLAASTAPYLRATINETCDAVHKGFGLRAALLFWFKLHLVSKPFFYHLGAKAMSVYRHIKHPHDYDAVYGGAGHLDKTRA